MNWLKKILASVGLALAATAASATVPTPCTGKFFNPISDTDWNNIFPITIAGVQITNGNNTISPMMAAMPPVCFCPSAILFGYPSPGIGVTYWQPVYISEIERRPGCLSSIGGVKVLSGRYELLASNQTINHQNRGKSANRMQVHWYQYPVFSMLEMFKSISCTSTSGYDLAYMTEVDPMWQDDVWSAIFTPEASLFANPIANLACSVDAVASIVGYPLDPLFWCAGTWGNIYPLAGNSNHSGDPFTLNNQIQAKFIARNARMGLAWQTVGPTAICSSHINPIWVKSQYRFNQVAPVTRKGRAVHVGDNGKFFQYPPVTNPPTQEHTVNLIWQGQQCCLKFIP